MWLSRNRSGLAASPEGRAQMLHLRGSLLLLPFLFRGIHSYVSEHSGAILENIRQHISLSSNKSLGYDVRTHHSTPETTLEPKCHDLLSRQIGLRRYRVRFNV
jgi:hypothetical protein